MARLRSRHRETHGLKKGTISPQPTASYRHEIRTSGWVHDRVAACASDLLLASSLHTHGMWFRQRKIVANLREQEQGRFVPDNFLHRLREVVNVPHHFLVTVSVAVHTGQLGIASSLRIQGLPLRGLTSGSRGTCRTSAVPS